MVLGADREVVALRVGRDALRNRPRREHAVALQAQVPVQRPGLVLLHDESRSRRVGGAGALGDPGYLRCRFGRTAGRFGGGGEVALGLVFGERISRLRRSGTAGRHPVTVSTRRGGSARSVRGDADAASGAIG